MLHPTCCSPQPQIEAREALYTRALECLDEKKELDKILDDLVANNKLVEVRIQAILREG